MSWRHSNWFLDSSIIAQNSGLSRFTANQRNIRTISFIIKFYLLTNGDTWKRKRERVTTISTQNYLLNRDYCFLSIFNLFKKLFVAVVTDYLHVISKSVLSGCLLCANRNHLNSNDYWTKQNLFSLIYNHIDVCYVRKIDECVWVES